MEFRGFQKGRLRGKEEVRTESERAASQREIIPLRKKNHGFQRGSP